MQLIIREAEEKDVDTIYELILSLACHENTQQYVVTNTETLREQGFGEEKKFGTLLAEQDGNAVGYLTYVWNYSTWAGGRYMYIENIFVYEKFRRLGVGAALMQEAKAICNKNDCLHLKWEVQSDNEKAIEFYKNLGATISFRGIGSFTAK
jgi:ribosomal protein S18 acetylase RimI-like enzyme